MSTNKLSKRHAGWEGAIQEAKKNIEQLETAINVFEKKKAAGEPWPETQFWRPQITAATQYLRHYRREDGLPPSNAGPWPHSLCFDIEGLLCRKNSNGGHLTARCDLDSVS